MNKDQIRKNTTAKLPDEIYGELEQKVYKESLVSLLYYFNGGSNGPEAKIAVAAFGNLAKREQSANNRKSLELIEERYEMNQQKRIGKQ